MTTIMKMLDLSTCHITEGDSKKLAEFSEDKNKLRIMPARIIAHQYGWFVNVIDGKEPELMDELIVISKEQFGFSEAFIQAYELATEKECEWINFDQDADLCDELDCFDW